MATLAEELASVVVLRDKRKGQRKRVGTAIEKLLNSKFERSSGLVPWNFSYAFGMLATQVLFREYYRGRFGKASEERYNDVNEVAVAIEHVFEQLANSEDLAAFEKISKQLERQIERLHHSEC